MIYHSKLKRKNNNKTKQKTKEAKRMIVKFCNDWNSATIYLFIWDSKPKTEEKRQLLRSLL